MSDFSKMNRLVFLLIPMLYLSANSWPMEHAPILPPSVIVVAPFSNLSEITNKKIAQVIDPAKVSHRCVLPVALVNFVLLF
jgi:hypothetical protein